MKVDQMSCYKIYAAFHTVRIKLLFFSILTLNDTEQIFKVTTNLHKFLLADRFIIEEGILNL